MAANCVTYYDDRPSLLSVICGNLDTFTAHAHTVLRCLEGINLEYEKGTWGGKRRLGVDIAIPLYWCRSVAQMAQRFTSPPGGWTVNLRTRHLYRIKALK